VVVGGLGRAARVDALGREVLQDLPNHPRLGDERDDPHRGAAAGAHERIDLVDPADQIRPPAAQRPQLGIISRLGGRGVGGKVPRELSAALVSVGAILAASE